MFPYWAMFLIPSFFLFINFNIPNKIKLFFWYIYLFLLIIFVGLRHEVGGDWFQYIEVYKESLNNFNFVNLSLRSDYLYGMLNYLFGLYFVTIHPLNLFFSMLFILSLNYFLDKEDDYLLALVGSIPFFIYIVSMGFTRQAISISFMLIILKILPANKYFFSLFLSILAIGFHKSFLVFNVVFIAFAKKNIFFLFIIFIFTISIFIAGYSHFIRLYYYYSGEGIHFISYGAFYRVFINLIFATIFLIFSKQLSNNNNERFLYIIISMLIFFSLIFVPNYSSLIDRINFYFIPIQLIVLMRINRLFINKKNYLYAKLIFLFFIL